MHHLHGRDRHRAPGAQRRAHAHARRRGHPGDLGQQDAEGRHQRGVPRLGRQRGPHPLPVRHRRGPAPVPAAGAGLPPGHRRRGAPPDPGADRPAAGRRRRVCRRRLQRDRPLPRLPGRRVRAAGRLRGGGPRGGLGRARGDADGGRAGHPARLPLLRPPGRRGPDHRAVLDLRRARLPGHRPRARLPEGQRARRVPPRHRRRGDARAAAAVGDRGHHSGHRERTRARGRARPRQGAGARGPRAGQPVGARRQGHGHGRAVLRPVRRAGRRGAGESK